MHTENQRLLDALNACLAACEHCATAFLKEQDVKMMVRCIQLDRDCADLCALAARFVARGSAHVKPLLTLCAEICKACGDECAQHTHVRHCQECADACRRCEQACRESVSLEM